MTSVKCLIMLILELIQTSPQRAAKVGNRERLAKSLAVCITYIDDDIRWWADSSSFGHILMESTLYRFTVTNSYFYFLMEIVLFQYAKTSSDV